MAFAVYRPSPDDFRHAPLYRKTARLRSCDIEMADHDFPVETLIRGFCETTNIVHKGDVIITGPAGERYVLNAEKFNRLYRRNPENANEFISTVTRRCIVINDDVVLDTEWGGTQYMHAGDIIAQDGIFFYGIERSIFEQTYTCIQ